jgi:hypothetical protein
MIFKNIKSDLITNNHLIGTLHRIHPDFKMAMRS